MKKQEPKVYKKEADLKKDVKDLLTKKKAKWFMPVPTGYSEGAVDFLVCYRGHFLAIETKIHPRKATALQIEFLCDIILAGGSSALAYDLEEVVEALRIIDEGEAFVSDEIIPHVEERYAPEG